MRIANIVLSALLVSSLAGGPAFAAATNSNTPPQKKQQNTQVIRRAPPKDAPNGGFTVHAPKNSSTNSSSWLYGKNKRSGWSF